MSERRKSRPDIQNKNTCMLVSLYLWIRQQQNLASHFGCNIQPGLIIPGVYQHDKLENKELL
jgi:hypothetical protein